MPQAACQDPDEEYNLHSVNIFWAFGRVLGFGRGFSALRFAKCNPRAGNCLAGCNGRRRPELHRSRHRRDTRDTAENPG